MGKTFGKSGAYQAAVTACGILLWAGAAASVVAGRSLREQLTILLFAPLVIAASLFRNIFPLPSSLKFRGEKITFTLTDAFILLIACWYGAAPAVVVAGLEGFISSRRATRILASNLFSFGMMSLTAAASGAVLAYAGGGAQAAPDHTRFAVAILLSSIVHTTVNLGLLSTLFALRNGTRVARNWRDDFLCGGPLFLALLTGTAVSSMYLMLQLGVSIGVVLCAPVLIAISIWLRQYRNGVQERINLIEKSNQERIAVMDKGHRQTIEALAVAINAKDEVTHEHVLRVQLYAAGVARILGCTDAEIEALRAGALLHDIGKIAVPDYILNKPGKLTAAEFHKMKIHTVAGAQILSRVEFPYPVVPVVRHHHERWDGKGYPDGLKGDDIPLTARILTVVDCFDAVREDRQYRKAFTREEAIKYIMEGSGTFYDPRVVGIFITHLPEFEAEIQAHRDDPVPSYGIEPMEQLSEAALKVAPAAGLAEESKAGESGADSFGDEEQQALHDLSSALRACASTEDALAVFAGRLGALVPFDTCAVTRVAPGSGESVVVHAAGRNANLLEGRVVQPGEGVTGWVLANRKPFCNADPKLDLHPHLAERFADYRTLAAVPVEGGGELHGALTVYSAALAEYDAGQQRLLQKAADTLAPLLAAPNDAPHPQPALAAVPPPTEASIASELTH